MSRYTSRMTKETVDSIDPIKRKTNTTASTTAKSSKGKRRNSNKSCKPDIITSTPNKSRNSENPNETAKKESKNKMTSPRGDKNSAIINNVPSIGGSDKSLNPYLNELFNHFKQPQTCTTRKASVISTSSDSSVLSCVQDSLESPISSRRTSLISKYTSLTNWDLGYQIRYSLFVQEETANAPSSGKISELMQRNERNLRQSIIDLNSCCGVDNNDKESTHVSFNLNKDKWPEVPTCCYKCFSNY